MKSTIRKNSYIWARRRIQYANELQERRLFWGPLRFCIVLSAVRAYLNFSCAIADTSSPAHPYLLPKSNTIEKIEREKV